MSYDVTVRRIKEEELTIDMEDIIRNQGSNLEVMDSNIDGTILQVTLEALEIDLEECDWDSADETDVRYETT